MSLNKAEKIGLASVAFAFIAVILAITVGVTDAYKSSITSYGSKFRVTLYSGGTPVRSWISTGRVATTENSDGWEFRDSATNRFVRVSGSVSVEQE
jgi:hypothetical protein